MFMSRVGKVAVVVVEKVIITIIGDFVSLNPKKQAYLCSNEAQSIFVDKNLYCVCQAGNRRSPTISQKI